MPSNVKNQRDCSSGKGEVQRFFLECISARTSQKTQQPVSLFSFPWMNSYINLKDKINHPHNGMDSKESDVLQYTRFLN